MKKLLVLALVGLLHGCAVIQSTGLSEEKPSVTGTMLQKEFDTIPAPASGKPVSVAVYSFTDKTGQRKPQSNIASLSTAVTQGAETFLIQALQNVGRSQWFEVVERVGVDNLTKERLIIRQMREAYEGSNARPLMPLQFAGMIVEGGIIGYDSTVHAGGAGMRVFGIGKQTQWSQDVVTVSLRAISVNTGKVLMSVTVQKTILSTSDGVTALKFFDAGTKAFEGEAGLTINEPGTYAVKAAVEMAVVELIKEGRKKDIWAFKTEGDQNELVQKTTPSKGATETASALPKPSESADSGGQEGRAKTEPQSDKKEITQPTAVPSGCVKCVKK